MHAGGHLWRQTPCRRKRLQWVLTDEEGFAETMRRVPRWHKPSQGLHAWIFTRPLLLRGTFSSLCVSTWTRIFVLASLCFVKFLHQEKSAQPFTELHQKQKKYSITHIVPGTQSHFTSSTPPRACGTHCRTAYFEFSGFIKVMEFLYFMPNHSLSLCLIQPLTERHKGLPALCLEYSAETLAYILPKLETQNIFMCFCM